MFLLLQISHLWVRVVALVTLGFAWSLAGAELSDGAKVEFFNNEIYPILKDNCYKCHGARERIKGEFRLTDRDGMLRGGESGAAINRDMPEDSLLLAMLTWKDENHEMPPEGKLPEG